MKLSIGLILAHGFPIPVPFVISYSRFLQCLLTGEANHLLPADRRITNARVLFGQGFPIDHARNELVSMFLDEDNGDYLLFLDADMTHPQDIAHRLLANNVDLVSGRYQLRKPPYWTIAMRKVGSAVDAYQTIDKVDPDAHGLVKIDAGGAGALLMSRLLLTAMRDRIGPDWFRYQDGPDGPRSRSEDMWFYEQAIECGFQPYLDTTVMCGHVASEVVDYRMHIPYRKALETALQEVE